MQAGEHDLEATLAHLLHLGTYIAAALLAIGWLTSVFSVWSASTQIINAGILVLLLLPISRLCVMMCVFFKQRDFFLAAVTAGVLTIICVAFAFGFFKCGKV